MNILKKYKRKLALRSITGNMGRVVEDEDEIICYVKQKKVGKGCIFLGGCHSFDNGNTARKYGIDKPIHYIFDGLECSSDIYGYDSMKLSFRNCYFKNFSYISLEGDCEFENCTFTSSLFYDIYADNLTIKSSSISDLAGYNRFHVVARNKLSLIDVDGIGDYYFKIKNVYFSSDKEILFKNTNIDCLSISIDTEKIVSVNSNLKARKNANIESYEISDLVLDSPNIICNDINVSSGKMCLNKGNTLLDKKREDLINVLKEIRDKCKDINELKVKKVSEKIQGRPISKVLKR